MIEEYGNFWNINADARCITTNGALRKNGNAVMGSGIALQARERCKKKHYNIEMALGVMIKNNGNHVFYLGYNLFSFPTKHHWRDPKSDINLIKRSSYEIIDLINKSKDYKKILLTRPGCGNGKLEWKEVKKVIQNILDDRFIII